MERHQHYPYKGLELETDEKIQKKLILKLLEKSNEDLDKCDRGQLINKFCIAFGKGEITPIDSFPYNDISLPPGGIQDTLNFLNNRQNKLIRSYISFLNGHPGTKPQESIQKEDIENILRKYRDINELNIKIKEFSRNIKGEELIKNLQPGLREFKHRLYGKQQEYFEQYELLLAEREEWARKLINHAESFEDLYTALEKVGSIKGSQETYNFTELINRIKLVRKGEEKLDIITNRYGLRMAVKFLIGREMQQNAK